MLSQYSRSAKILPTVTLTASFKKEVVNKFTVTVSCQGDISYVSIANKNEDWVDTSSRTFDENTKVWIGAYIGDPSNHYCLDARTKRLLYHRDPYISILDKNVDLIVSNKSTIE